MTNNNVAYCVNSHGEKIYCGRYYSVHNLINGDYMYAGTVTSVTYTYVGGILAVEVHVIDVECNIDTWVNIDAIRGE